MGFFDRLDDAAERAGAIVSGVYGAAQAPFGLLKDMALIPRDEKASIRERIGVIGGLGKERAGQVTGNLFGPKEGLGALIGGLSKDVVRQPANVAIEKLEWGYREGIAEPTSTALYVTGKVGASSGGNFDRLLDADVYKEGYRQAQTTSPGQAFAVSASAIDPDDKQAVADLKDEWFYSPLTGSVDALLRIASDPTVILGKAAGAARTAALVRPIKDGADYNKIAGSRRFGKVNEKMEGKTADQIRDQFFPNDANGAALSSALAEAGDAATRAKVLRLAMGDLGGLRALHAERVDIDGQITKNRSDLAGLMERAIDPLQTVRSLDSKNFSKVNGSRQMSLFDDAEDAADGGVAKTRELRTERDRLEAEADNLYDRELRNQRSELMVGQIKNQIRYSRADDVRTGITRSHFYQKSRFAAPVRVAFNMRPPAVIDLHRPDGDIAVSQALLKTGISPEEQGLWRAKYMAVASPEGRGAVLMEMEDTVLAQMATDAKLTRDEMATLMTTVRDGRKGARETMAGRSYDGEGRSRMSFKDDGTGELIDTPLLATDTANLMVLGDLARAREALKDVGRLKERFGPAWAITEDVLTTFNSYWKPSVLLRVGWPIRVVTDEQMRIMGKVGVMATLANAGPGLANKIGNEVSRASAIASRGVDENGVRISRQEAAAAAPQKKIGFGEMEVGEYKIEKTFGTDVNNPNSAFEYTKSNPAFERLFRDPETQQINEMQRQTSDYRSIDPTDTDAHPPAWLHAINQKLGRDPMARIFLAGGSLEDAVKWLRTSDGREHLTKLPLRRRDLEAFAGAVQDQTMAYTLGNPRIMQAALKQQVTSDDLFRLAPDPSMRPPVHGGVLEDALGAGPFSKMLGGIVTKAYTALGSAPSDLISRHPFADHMYQSEAKRMIGILDSQAKKNGERLTVDDLALVERRSREFAISETQRLLYDFAERSDLAHLLRFVSPFFSAWQETMTRWAGIAVENPAYAARLAMVWQAPEKAGLITDENGNEIGEGMKTGDKFRLEDGTQAIVGKERLITIKVPEYAKDVLGITGLAQQGQVILNRKSANMILSGNPGVGVPVQIPVNEIVKRRPTLADSVKFVLPFGPTQNSLDSLLPATLRRVKSGLNGEEDTAFRNAAMRIYSDRVVDYNLGKTDVKADWEQAMKDTRAFFAVRTVASFVSPIAPGFRSPYQPQIDAFRRLKEEDPQTADQRFLDIYGPEFFPLVASFTKSADGVPPTVEAFTARNKYKDLIESTPELGGFIIGEEGAGEFSNAIYQYQKANKVKPGATINQRNASSFDEVAAQPNVKQGWMEYRKVSDLIESERINRGLPNLQVKGASDLAEIKRQMIDDLEDKYPEWYEAFSTVDRNAMQKRLIGFRAIAYDDRMQGRPEMRGVRDYFSIRELMKKELAGRKDAGGSGTLDSSANTDLKEVWDTLTAKIVEENLAFSDTYYRYLERDDLSAD